MLNQIDEVSDDYVFSQSPFLSQKILGVLYRSPSDRFFEETLKLNLLVDLALDLLMGDLNASDFNMLRLLLIF